LSGKAFLIVPLSLMLTFAVLFIAAVANTSRPERHKRLMPPATVSLPNAPVARPLLVWVWPLQPPATPG
jgi:hypothetical protein